MQLEEDYGLPVTFAEDLDRPPEVQRVSPFMQQGVNPFAQANANQLFIAASQAQWVGTIPNTARAVSVTSPLTHHCIQITNGVTTFTLPSTAKNSTFHASCTVT